MIGPTGGQMLFMMGFCGVVGWVVIDKVLPVVLKGLYLLLKWMVGA